VPARTTAAGHPVLLYKPRLLKQETCFRRRHEGSRNVGLKRDCYGLTAPSRQAEDLASRRMRRVEFLRYHVRSYHKIEAVA
jgi:hypothetical protein